MTDTIKRMLTQKYVHEINTIVKSRKIPNIKYISPKVTKIMDGLWLGNLNDANNLSFLIENNITVVINISFEKIVIYDNIDYYQFRITDDDICDNKMNIINELTQVTDCLNYYLGNNRNILIHCKKGHHRSASILALYMVRYHNYDLSHAVDYIKNLRPTAFRRFPCIMYQIIAYCILFCNE